MTEVHALPQWLPLIALSLSIVALVLAAIVMAVRLTHEGVVGNRKIETDSALIVAMAAHAATSLWVLDLLSLTDFQIVATVGRIIVIVFLAISLFRIKS